MKGTILIIALLSLTLNLNLQHDFSNFNPVIIYLYSKISMMIYHYLLIFNMPLIKIKEQVIPPTLMDIILKIQILILILMAIIYKLQEIII